MCFSFKPSGFARSTRVIRWRALGDWEA